MRKVSFSVPGKPVGQGRPRMTVRNGRAIIYKPSMSREYEREISRVAKEAMGGDPPLTAPVCLHLLVCKSPPSGASKKEREAMLSWEILPCKKPDLDNVVKAVSDALTGVVWLDDCQVIEIHACQRYADTPLVRVLVTDEDGIMGEDRKLCQEN